MVARGKFLLFKKNMAAQLRFAKLHLNKQQHQLNNPLWTDKINVEKFGTQCTVSHLAKQTPHIN